MAELAIGESAFPRRQSLAQMVGRNTVIATIIMELNASSKYALNRRGLMTLILLTVLESIIVRALFEESMSSLNSFQPGPVLIYVSPVIMKSESKKKELERSSAFEITLDAT